MRHRRIIYQSKNKNLAVWTVAFNTRANTSTDRQLEFLKKKKKKKKNGKKKKEQQI